MSFEGLLMYLMHSRALLEAFRWPYTALKAAIALYGITHVSLNDASLMNRSFIDDSCSIGTQPNVSCWFAYWGAYPQNCLAPALADMDGLIVNWHSSRVIDTTTTDCWLIDTCMANGPVTPFIKLCRSQVAIVWLFVHATRPVVVTHGHILAHNVVTASPLPFLTSLGATPCEMTVGTQTMFYREAILQLAGDIELTAGELHRC